MKKRFILSALLIVGIFSFSGVAYPWGSAVGDGSRYRAIQETAVFYNNSGSTLTSGQVVVLDTSATSGSTLGSYVTTTTTADVSGVVGCVLDAEGYTASDGGPVIVITKGPARVAILDASDPVAATDFVGTSTTAGYGGKWAKTPPENGGILGKALEAGSGLDTAYITVYINPSN